MEAGVFTIILENLNQWADIQMKLINPQLSLNMEIDSKPVNQIFT